MKFSLVFILIAGLVGFFGWHYFAPSESVEPNENKTFDYVSEYKTYSDADTGLQFEYRTEPDGYVVDDLTSLIDEEAKDVIVKILVMMTTEDKLALETGPDRGGPPTINIMVFKNKRQLTPKEWLNDAPLFSNVEFLQGPVDDEVMVGGQKALRYFTDGMFQSENVVVAKGDYIYHLTGSFAEEGSLIQQDFTHLLDTLTLTLE